MSKEMIWAYMLMLSDHQWEDESSPLRGWNLAPQYTDDIEFSENAWDKIVPFIAEKGFNAVLVDVGDGIKYESHPEISAPNAWDKDHAKKKLDEMRALGLTPIPKLNFSTCHDTWLKDYRRMVSTPTYYRVASDVISEICELFGNPELFHLGFDEEEVHMQKSYEMTIVRNGDLWWHDLYYLAGECEKHGARPWVWSDYMWNHEEKFLNKMPKSILQSNWFYGHLRDYPTDSHNYKMLRAYDVLDKHGFDQIPTCSTWDTNHNSIGTIAYCKENLDPSYLKGIMTASWEATTDRMLYALYNDAHQFYLGRKKYYPDSF
ncbi:MAG: Tat pathway signal protein [Clostridia bacterium]|nr:Tat pathway signal protein [Clostridia bacterium]